MLQINLDPSGLTKQQREAIAGFILAYPYENVGAPLEAKTINIETSSVDPQAIAKYIAHSIVGVEASPTAPGDTTAVILPFVPTNVPTQPVPIPEVAAPAPTAPAAPLNPAPGVELDKEGLPWDSRIHSSSKAKVSDGTWKLARNVDKTLVETVKAELRKLMAVPSVAYSTPDAVTTPIPAAAFSVESAIVPPPPSPPTIIAPPAASPVGQPPVDTNAFVALIGATAAQIQAGKLTQAELDQICVAHGVPSVTLLANRPDLVPAVQAAVNNLVATRP